MFDLSLFAQTAPGLQQAEDSLYRYLVYPLYGGALLALVWIVQLIRQWQFRREQLAIKKFQDGMFDRDPNEIKTVNRARLLRKLKPTKILLAFAGKQDRWFDPKYLKEVAKEVFSTFRDAWEDRDFDLLKGYVTLDFYQNYLEEMESRTGKDRLQSFQDLRLTRMEVVHFNASAKTENHSFTVLITAESLYDDEDDEDDEDEDFEEDRIAYQEFWTFVRRKRWQLHKFRSVSSSDALQEQNLLSPEAFKEFRDRANTDPNVLDFVAGA